MLWCSNQHIKCLQFFMSPWDSELLVFSCSDSKTHNINFSCLQQHMEPYTVDRNGIKRTASEESLIGARSKYHNILKAVYVFCSVLH